MKAKLRALFLALGATAIAAALVAPAANAATCPNEAIRASQISEAFPLGTTELPACMALEMVSPPKKFGQETLTLSAFSEDGSRVVFVSKAALAGTEALQAFGGDSYVASRGADGWSVAPTSPPASADITAGGAKRGGPFAFSSDLGSWSLLGATQAQAAGGKAQFFNGDLGGAFAPLSPLLVPIDDSGNEDLPFIISGGFFALSGTAADLSTTAFRMALPSVAYLSEDPRNPKGAESTNSYLVFRDVSGVPTVQLLARDQAGKVWGGRCGADVGGAGAAGGIGEGLNQGAISPDGSRVFFSTRPAQPFDPAHPTEALLSPPCDTSNPLRIMVRTGEGPQIEELLPGGPSEAGDDRYQAASVDGSKVLLTSPRSLVASDQDTSPEACGADLGASKGCDLYLYDSDLPAGNRLIQVSAGENVPGKHEVGKGADVLSSITATSADGSHVYFAAQGVVTADTNPAGKVAVKGQPNLYLYVRDAVHPSGELSFIATLVAGDKGKAWSGGDSLANGAAYPVPLLGGPEGGDGHLLFFLSMAQLDPEDTDAGHTDVYRYDSVAEALQCISCATNGNSTPVDVFAGSVEGSSASNFAEQGRWASEDGQTVAFATGAPLLESDEDGEVNPYLWREGQLVQLPGVVRDPLQPYKFPAVSPGGEEVAFTTTTPLLPQDGDGTRDAYVVRADGGFPNQPPPPTPCDPLSEGACQGPTSVPSAVPAVATPSVVGPGNEKAPARCRKGQVRKRGSCVKQSKKPKQKKSKKRANDERGGKK
jgi:hypothetical protein